jgi:hypothetical protein
MRWALACVATALEWSLALLRHLGGFSVSYALAFAIANRN